VTHPAHEQFEAIDGHIVVNRDGSLSIIDTGAPLSTTAPSMVSDHLGRPIAELLGCDALDGWVLEIEWNALRLSWAPSREPLGDSIPLVMSPLGVPLIDVLGPDGLVRCVFDTGAPLSYVPGAVAKRHDVVGEREDFFPGLGEFSTSVYRVPMMIGKSALPLECGVLTPLLQMALSLRCPSGYIVGWQILTGAISRMDLRGGWLQIDRNGT
jgi:hypothetical protein